MGDCTQLSSQVMPMPPPLRNLMSLAFYRTATTIAKVAIQHLNPGATSPSSLTERSPNALAGHARLTDLNRPGKFIEIRSRAASLDQQERWLSGRKRRFAKPLNGEIRSGGSNPPLSVSEPPRAAQTRPSSSEHEASGVSSFPELAPVKPGDPQASDNSRVPPSPRRAREG